MKRTKKWMLLSLVGLITLCPANDTCPFLRIGTSDRYLEISKEAMSEVHEILEKYGMVFPCV